MRILTMRKGSAINGSIAEAAYGVPNWIKDKAMSYLDAPLIDVYERRKAFLKNG